MAKGSESLKNGAPFFNDSDPFGFLGSSVAVARRRLWRRRAVLHRLRRIAEPSQLLVARRLPVGGDGAEAPLLRRRLEAEPPVLILLGQPGKPARVLRRQDGKGVPRHAALIHEPPVLTDAGVVRRGARALALLPPDLPTDVDHLPGGVAGAGEHFLYPHRLAGVQPLHVRAACLVQARLEGRPHLLQLGVQRMRFLLFHANRCSVMRSRRAKAGRGSISRAQLSCPSADSRTSVSCGVTASTGVIELPLVPPALFLTGGEVRRLLDMVACLAAVERAFGDVAADRPIPSAMLGLSADEGSLHVKAALMARQPGGAHRY